MNAQNDTTLGQRIMDRCAIMTDSLLGVVSALFPPLASWRRSLAQRHRQQAIRDYELGQYENSIASFRKAIAITPHDPELHSDLGQIFYEMRNLEHAAQEFRKALKFDQANLRALKGLGFTVQDMGDLSEAVYLYLRFLHDSGTDLDVLLNLGSALHDQGNFEEALVYYAKAEKLEPNNPVVLEYRARTLYSIGELEEAEQSIQRALTIEPRNPEAWRFSGFIAEGRGDPAAALSNYEQAIQCDPSNADAFLDAAILLEQMTRYQAAIDYSQRAVDLFEKQGNSSGAATAYWNLGWAHYRATHWQECIDASRKAVEIDPRLFQARFNLALAYLLQGNKAQALDEYMRAAQGVSAADLKHWAIDDLKNALSQYPALDANETLRFLETKYIEQKESSGATKFGDTALK